MCAGQETTTLAAAQMSLPYALAVRCLRGNASLGSYQDEVRAAPEIQRFMTCIDMQVEPSLAALDEPFIQVTSRDGRSATRQVKLALGGPLNPLSDAALIDKFRSLASRALPAPQVDGLIELCMALGAATDVSQLLELLLAPRTPQ
jgi:2-methylcitrate dehydratase PrpD